MVLESIDYCKTLSNYSYFRLIGISTSFDYKYKIPQVLLIASIKFSDLEEVNLVYVCDVTHTFCT